MQLSYEDQHACTTKAFKLQIAGKNFKREIKHLTSHTQECGMEERENENIFKV
jgi:hypothetical protein